MKTHDLKIEPQYFDAVKAGTKTFEIRFNDRHFEVGDYVLLREWCNGDYMGREVEKRITYILHGKNQLGLVLGYVCFSMAD